MVRDVHTRFWEKVDRAASWRECWLWTASAHGGCGQFSINGRPRSANRVAYWLASGRFPPDDEYVVHTCDESLCVNPAHLRVADAPHAVLDWGDVRAIRRAYATTDVTQTSLADEYGVDPSTVGNIVRGDLWPDDAYDPWWAMNHAYRDGEANPNASLTWADVREIRRRYAAGDTSYRALADEFGVTHRTIGMVVRGESWPAEEAPDAE